MPPFIPKRRRKSTSSSDTVISIRPTTRSSLFNTADSQTPSATLQDNQDFLNSLNRSDDETSLSDVSSSNFEDVPPAYAGANVRTDPPDDDDEPDWEDAIANTPNAVPRAHPSEPSGDLEITIDKDGSRKSLLNPHGKKQGPSKIQRQIRFSTHCLHVQYLLFHNLIRNGWACNGEVQRILVAQLPRTVMIEVEKWRASSGLEAVGTSSQPSPRPQRPFKRKRPPPNERNQRDWGQPAVKQEKGVPNMSSGDPLLRLLRVMTAYWKKRFAIVAPGLRKQGYKPLPVIQDELASWKEYPEDAMRFGERIRGIDDFITRARKCEGSRDVGACLFTALLRGLGLDARFVASLQPIGYGWNKNEEALAMQDNGEVSSTKTPTASRSGPMFEAETRSEEEQSAEAEGQSVKSAQEASIAGPNIKPRSKDAPARARPKHDAAKAAKQGASHEAGDGKPIEISDDESIVDITPPIPQRKVNATFDRDILAPNYWTEVISPISNKIYPASTSLHPTVATNPEHLAQFEPRGAKADKAKQVFAYVVAYSADGTAKEVTTRYLKRRMWPGRTKGVRMPIEKVPVYNHRNKVKHYEELDWFKTVLSGYERPDAMRSTADKLEDETDLVPVKPAKTEAKIGEDTLQGYKISAKFVLERHLRREEALSRKAQPVKTFSTGKGDKAQEEPVYLRKDVEICRTGESWHKEGRAVKAGEHPLKKVPVRAVTMNRKREVEEAERDGGEKLMQGMYARDQTEWIIPPPIENGVIPKNAFGNMDCYVPSMVPTGAVHIPLRSTVRVCKRLRIDYAEAVTGFEFGKRMAVPVITGVVVAADNEQWVIGEWEKDEEERRIREEGKREKVALATWRKWLMGLRVIRRVREEYGHGFEAHIKESTNPFTNQKKTTEISQHDHDFEDSEGGHAGPPDKESDAQNLSSNEEVHFGGGFLVENGEDEGSPPEGDFTVKGRSRSNDATQHPLPIARELSDAISTDKAHETVEISRNGVSGSEQLQDNTVIANAGTGAKRGRKRKAATANERELKSPRTTLTRHSARDGKHSKSSTHVLDSLPERKTRKTSTKSFEDHDHDNSKEESAGRRSLRSTPKRGTTVGGTSG